MRFLHEIPEEPLVVCALSFAPVLHLDGLVLHRVLLHLLNHVLLPRVVLVLAAALKKIRYMQSMVQDSISRPPEQELGSFVPEPPTSRK